MRIARLLPLLVMFVPMCQHVRPVPADLLRPCSIPEPKSNSVNGAVQVANARKEALQKCNAQLKRISEHQ